MADDSRDEKVDGPKIAAMILSSMKGPQKDRLVKAIQKAAPTIAAKIKENLLRFDEIGDPTSAGVQLLIKEVQHSDIVLSLKTATSQVKEALLSNMSERKRRTIEEDFAALPPTKLSDVEEAQSRIVRKLEELRTAGLIKSKNSADAWV